MAAYPPDVWGQLKNLTRNDLIKALRRAGWEEDAAVGSGKVFYNPETKQRVHIHVHPHQTYGPDTLKYVLECIGWTPEQMRTYKLIK